MTAETDLPPLPERFDCTNGSAQRCYGCYTMTRDDLGDYVLAEDYDALRNASEALQAEVEALRAEVSAVKESLSTDLRAMRAERERAMEARQLISGDLATAEARADKLDDALRDLEVCANTVDYCYCRRPSNLASALVDLRESAEKARALLRDQEEGHEQ